MLIIKIGGSIKWLPEMEIKKRDEISKIANFEAPVA